MVSVASSDANGPAAFPPPPSEQSVSKIPFILPHERVFPIQIGSELFKLSGASISSDAPSYFSQYFLCQLKSAEENREDLAGAIRTLYIDRDPTTFRDISLHLQGYHVQPRDGTHFVRLFADAQFYSLPKLVSQLYEESIFISIGHREFQIPRDLFNDPGNSPNYFSLGFGVFFSRPDELFPGLERDGLIRPPSILPPSVPKRSAETFAELLHLLRGYPVEIRNETHRQELLRDARYFHFKGLEQRLIPHSISFNQARHRNEIALRLENIQKSGISVARDVGVEPFTSWVNYARPYVDERAAELVLEIRGETTKLHFTPDGLRAEFFADTKTRVARLFEVISTKLNLPPTTQPLGLLMATGGAGSQPATPGNTPLSEDLVRVAIEAETSVVLDGNDYHHYALDELNGPYSSSSGAQAYSTDDSTTPNSLVTTMNPRKRRRTDGSMAAESWVVKTGQWRLRIQDSKGGKSAVECVLVAVKLDASSSEQSRNKVRAFLS